MARVGFVFLCISTLLIPHAALAANCADAAKRAEARHGIPTGLLQAISIVETSKSATPPRVAWPWTVNIAGKGYWFDTRSAAEKFVKAKRLAGVRSMDLGCFQINTKWHAQGFDTIYTMFDADKAADYAARFLVKLNKNQPNWHRAVAAYHSKDATRGSRYRGKVYNALAEVPASAAPQHRALHAGFKGAPSYGGGVALTMFDDRAPLFNQSSAKSIIP